jgi:hypothetical protein
MAVESERGCGYRKAGGLYLVSGGIGEPCERLPISTAKCPCCKRSPIEKVRGPQFIGAQYVFGMALPCVEGDAPVKSGHHGHCPLCDENLLLREGDPNDQFLVLWIGKAHYPTPADWTKESNNLGVSRRLSAIPKGLVLGKTWVLVGHPEAISEPCDPCGGKGFVQPEGKGPAACPNCKGERRTVKPGIFHAFRPRAIELVVTPSMKKQKWVQDMVKKHKVELVEVPENDPDHAPKVSKKSARKKAMERHARKLAPKKDKKAEAGA